MTTPDVALAGFASALRHAGLAVTADRVQLFLRAVAALDAAAHRRRLLGRPGRAVRWTRRHRQVRRGVRRLVLRRAVGRDAPPYAAGFGAGRTRCRRRRRGAGRRPDRQRLREYGGSPPAPRCRRAVGQRSGRAGATVRHPATADRRYDGPRAGVRRTAATSTRGGRSGPSCDRSANRPASTTADAAPDPRRVVAARSMCPARCARTPTACCGSRTPWSGKPRGRSRSSPSAPGSRG